MYSVGVVTLLQLLWEHELPSSFVLVTLGLFLSLVFLCRRNQRHQDTPAHLPRFFLFNTFTFFRRRYDFFVWGFQVTGQRLFQFRLLRNNVVVVSGEQGRRDFFNAKGLDLQEGFVILSGALPIIHGVTTGLRQQRVARIYRRLANAQRSERLTELIPEILNDGRRLLQPWEKAGTLDPFDRIYELIFQATVRCLTCTEIADDPEIVARLRQLFDKVDRGTTPATVLFPWFPSSAMVSKARATKQIYDIIVNAIKVREQSGVSHNDNLQLFLDSGDEMSTIAGFMIGLVTAGARSTGNTASWLITYLGCHPRWRDEARAEVENLISSHALDTISACDSPLQSSTALSSIPLTAWESETPVMDMLIRETLRIAQPHTAMRRNVGPETYIDGKVIPTGTLVVYPFSDVHLNPALYPDPWRFDPTRPQLQADSAYVGWGGGRVTCLGSRTARLTMKLVTALLLLDFDFDTVDENGRIADPHPIPNWNDDLACRPVRGQFFLKHKSLDFPCGRRSPGTHPL
ncbi:cytochrome P450 [Lactarius akahatsu]|uniref:Cytochrome P450 n=1 Tax=Lactarius akahatsu TaxID=416441 RepID=A0AAD4QBV6_9AGAM|nr:cytochrome P450 [Lactarius akahatsu]